MDALFIANCAPHKSANNLVERRMAPLSRDPGGIILPHDSFATHLDKNEKTVDFELEILSFQKAEVSAEVWNQHVIDKFPVISEFVCTGWWSEEAATS